jgi:hypothetical protein
VIFAAGTSNPYFSTDTVSRWWMARRRMYGSAIQMPGSSGIDVAACLAAR